MASIKVNTILNRLLDGQNSFSFVSIFPPNSVFMSANLRSNLWLLKTAKVIMSFLKKGQALNRLT
jgi:hypothetical protein